MRLFSIDTCSDHASANFKGGAAGHTNGSRTALLAVATAVLLCTAALRAHAANFTCSWNDATADWPTAADWSTCNSTFPTNGQPTATDTYNVTISQGNPTLTTDIGTVELVSITGPGIWTLTGTSAQATLNGDLSSSGALHLDTSFGSGGSKLKIDGALSNVLSGIGGSVQVGNVAISGTRCSHLRPDRADHADPGRADQPGRGELCAGRLGGPCGDAGLQRRRHRVHQQWRRFRADLRRAADPRARPSPTAARLGCTTTRR